MILLPYYLGVKSPHEFDVERLKRMAGGLNKVDTRMNTIINDIGPVRLILSLKIGIKSGLDALQNRLPTIISRISTGDL